VEDLKDPEAKGLAARSRDKPAKFEVAETVRESSLGVFFSEGRTTLAFLDGFDLLPQPKSSSSPSGMYSEDEDMAPTLFITSSRRARRARRMTFFLGKGALKSPRL
jgi:hypothetical protein